MGWFSWKSIPFFRYYKCIINQFKLIMGKDVKFSVRITDEIKKRTRLDKPLDEVVENTLKGYLRKKFVEEYAKEAVLKFEPNIDVTRMYHFPCDGDILAVTRMEYNATIVWLLENGFKVKVTDSYCTKEAFERKLKEYTDVSVKVRLS